MAACTFGIGTADTGPTPNISGSFTPASGDYLAVLAICPGTATETAPTCTSSIGGFTFTEVGHAFFNGSSYMIVAFVSDALVSNTAGQTVTVDTPNDQAAGTNIFVYRISGMSRTGLSGVLQFKTNSGAGGGTPAATFDASCLTGNPTLAFMGNVSNPAGVTAPTGWTEDAAGDIGFITPDCGGEISHRDSGFTGTTVTWGSTSATAWGTMILEFDTTAAAVASGLTKRRLMLGVG